MLKYGPSGSITGLVHTPTGGRPEAGDAAGFGSASEAMMAVSRLLGRGVTSLGPAEVGDRLVREARAFFRVTRALFVTVDQVEGHAEIAAMIPDGARPEGTLEIADLRPLGLVVESGEPARVAAPAASTLGTALGIGDTARSALLLPMYLRETVGSVLVLIDERDRDFSAEEISVAASFASAAAAGLVQLQAAADHAAQTARQASLARAAKALNDTLDMNQVLVEVCDQAISILDADLAAVLLGSREEGLRIEATRGLPPEAVGTRLEPGEGISWQAFERDQPVVTNDYVTMPERVNRPIFGPVRSAFAVPLRWDGELRGTLTLGYCRPYRIGQEHVGLLEAFAEIAAAACRNASAHAGLALAARTDSLTGCLNHAAMQDALRRELERCRRTGHQLSLALVDLDDFKQVNEQCGHLAGDEVLRIVGRALSHGVRAYDLVARYGGDEFAIVAIGANEGEAAEVVGRAIAAVGRGLGEADLPAGGVGATAGVAEWNGEEGQTSMIERADRALLYAKHEGARGQALRASEVPEPFLPRGEVGAGGERREDGQLWSDLAREQTDRLRKRTRQLALANALGARLAAMTDPREITTAAVEELHRAFGYYLCAVIRIRADGYVEGAAGIGEPFMRLVHEQNWCQPRDVGLIGRCLRERRPVLTGDVHSEPEYQATEETREVRSELVVPLMVGRELWGAINLEEVEPDAFDEDDVQAVETIADQVGSALLSATLYERLERAYLGTADALSKALAKEGPEGSLHTRSVLELAEAVARRLGMDADDRRDLRFAAIFHHIGGIEVREDVAFLPEVRPLLRHMHEHWDGTGGPDGLAGEAIPLGARVLHACLEYDALGPDSAQNRLARDSGRRFDPRVLEALAEVIAEADARLEDQEAFSDSR
jgi:diguanylate cyclase (GGDEF)-like protein